MNSLASASLPTLSEYIPSGLATTAWAFARLRVLHQPLLEAIASAAIPKITEFQQEELRMLLGSLARLDDLSHVWSLLNAAEDHRRALHAPRNDCYDLSRGWMVSTLSTLLAECEQRGFIQEEVALLKACAPAHGDDGGLRAAVSNTIAMRLYAAGHHQEAIDSLRDAASKGLWNSASQMVWGACAASSPPPEVLSSLEGPRNFMDSRSRIAYDKELGLLHHVFATATPGDPMSACKAVERFGEDVLNAQGLWLKVAGGNKAEVLVTAVRDAPPTGLVLEIGTYFGYSAARMAASLFGVRIASLEVDPAHAVIARNFLAFAGIQQRVDVWTGHSKDILPQLPACYSADGGFEVRAVFMDQRGSRYDEDLATLEGLGALSPGAVVVCDNVLKPGAPLFLWRVCKGGGYDTRIVRVPEFAMPSEDWMSVSIRRPAAEHGDVPAPVPPQELLELQWEADQMRARATGKAVPGSSVTFVEWASFAERMKCRLAQHGIIPSVDARAFAQ